MAGFGRKPAFDFGQHLEDLVGRLEAVTGYKLENRDIPDDMTFRQWCESLAEDKIGPRGEVIPGMKIDGKPFSLKERPALIPLYDRIPTTVEQAKGFRLVVMKATQLGLTVWEVLANLYCAIKFSPVTIGMFMPDQGTASYKSEYRFMRIVRSVPQLLRRLTHRMDAEGEHKVGEGNILTRTVGESILLFLWTSGKVTTESRPMDIVTLDEVQEMTLEQIDKVLARMGDSAVDMALMLSTSNMPDMDIDYWYKQGTQEVWETECLHCHEHSDLSDPALYFPKRSIAYNTGQVEGAPLNDYVWVCPHCQGYIADPQRGRLRPTRPEMMKETGVCSVMLPRTISPTMTARKFYQGWARAKTPGQKKSFYNRTLARPYIDASQLPVTEEHLKEAARLGALAGLKWEKSGRDTFMGIDQMGGFNAVIIKKRLPDGRQAVVHVEAIFGEDPFAECSKLMKRYNVAVCVVEQLPNVNDARRFANKKEHKGRVFLAGYADLKHDMIVWGDAITRTDTKTAEEDRSRYAVTLSQYPMMQTALYRIRDGLCLFPDPDGLVQTLVEGGEPKPLVICREWVWLHLTKVALVVEEDEQTRKAKGKVLKVGIDPHFAFANMLCDVAWARSYGNAQFILPGAENTEEDKAAAAAPKPVEIQEPAGLPAAVVAAIADSRAASYSGKCGGCRSYMKDSGRCVTRGFYVERNDPGCEDYG